jgi:ferredoxin-NADP reductase
VHNTQLLSTGQRLPADAVALILGADTAYLATTFDPPPEVAGVHKPRVGINHRGGRPGFVRVRNDGRTLVLPNYAGNRVLNSLGNIHCTPRAALVVPCLVTGSVLYVTGNAETVYDEAARALMPEADVITTLEVTGFALIADALPLRYTHAHTSAYSPPVRYLAEEEPVGQEHEPVLRLVRAVIRSPTLTSYFFRASGPLSCMKPAGTVVLDLRKAFADQNIGHDDCVRTWTVSHPPTPDTPEEFGITLRTKADGVLTPLMAAAVRDRAESVVELGIVAALRGTNSDIPLPNPGRHLWIAGGIGATPFMALGRYIAGGHWQAPWDIVLLVSTSEPGVLAGLFAEAFAGASNLHLALYLFISEATDMATLDKLEVLPFTTLQVHRGRIPADGALFETVDAKNRHIHICGPLPFVNNAMMAMQNAGVDPEAVFRERFTY